jgi:hypothetical protein
MLRITDQKLLEKIMSRLLKDKRTTPEDIFIHEDSVWVYWKNNKCTKIECMNRAELEHSSFDGHLYIQIKINPICLRKYNRTSIDFDIESDILVWNP